MPDPGDPQALNRYSHVGNQPLSRTDPTGHAYDVGIGGRGFMDYDVQRSANTLYWLALAQWFLELGPDRLELGIQYDATQDVKAAMESAGLYQAWAESGFLVPFEWTPPTIDERMDPNDPSTWDRALLVKGFATLWENHMIKGPSALRGIGDSTPEGSNDALGGTVGSLDRVTIEDDVQFFALKVTAENSWGYGSLSRPGGLPTGLVQDKKRGSAWSPFGEGGPTFDWPYGGTCYQVFSWPIPRR